MKFTPPFPLYKIQEDFINKASTTISNGQIGIFSSPTGTGKTLSLLCAAHAHFGTRKVFYCSRTHSQLNQAINELKKINPKINATVLGARKIFCKHKINEKNVENDDLNEKCGELVKNESCEYYNNLGNFEVQGPVDIEDIGLITKKMTVCGYFLVKEYLKKCEIVFLPYSLLFSRSGRASAGIQIEDSIVIVDEAHNIYETVVNLNTSCVSFYNLKKILSILEDFKRKKIAKNEHYKAKNSFVRKFEEKSKLKDEFFSKDIFKIENLISVLKKIETFFQNVKNDENVVGVDEFLLKTNLEDENFIEIEEFVRESKLVHRLGLIGSLKAAAHSITSFLLLLTVSDEYGRIFYSQSTAKFTPLDPKMYFSDILTCHSLILAGGTMEPVEQLQKIFTDRKFFYHAFETICTNFEALILPSGPTGKELRINFENRESLADEICLSIQILGYAVKKGGILVFLPSKEFLAQIKSKNFDFKKKVFYDDSDFFNFNHADEPAILISVLGGRLSEGINFNDNLCRLLVIIGVPYPTMNLEMKERIKYNGDDFASIVAMKSVNQAMGRAMRHKNDFAAMVLMDVRYSALENKISPWIAQRVKKMDFQKGFVTIKTFLEKNCS